MTRPGPLFTDQQLNIVKFCSEEVRRQQDSPSAVSWMVEAWTYAYAARQNKKPLSVGLIQDIAAIVTPKNMGGFRKVNVRVGWSVKRDWEEVPKAMMDLVDAWNDGRIDGITHPIAGKVDATAHFYLLFEDIHPFRDGNGRTGKILYSYIRDELKKPELPPNFWGGENL